MGVARSWFRLPLCHGQVFVASRSADAFAAGLSLTSPCNPRLLAIQERLLKASRIGLPCGLLSRRANLPAAIQHRLEAVINDRGKDGTTVAAVGTARQATRPHFVALLDTPSGRVFLKSTTDTVSADKEISMLEQLNGGNSSLRVPALLASGTVEGNHWFVADAMAPIRHRPVWEFPTSEIERLLPAEDRVAHGDLAPWNLREVDGQLWLIDWADSREAPPGYDRTYFESAAGALGYKRPHPPWPTEAVSEVTKTVQSRIDAGAEDLDRTMLDILLRS